MSLCCSFTAIFIARRDFILVRASRPRRVGINFCLFIEEGRTCGLWSSVVVGSDVDVVVGSVIDVSSQLVHHVLFLFSFR